MCSWAEKFMNLNAPLGWYNVHCTVQCFTCCGISELWKRKENEGVVISWRELLLVWEHNITTKFWFMSNWLGLLRLVKFVLKSMWRPVQVWRCHCCEGRTKHQCLVLIEGFLGYSWILSMKVACYNRVTRFLIFVILKILWPLGLQDVIGALT